ncbi:ABC transporter substrate-binding protein [Pseudarthrobacter sulfonivorans]|uniref:ABC transporter substrate-binding protein n=1 Tax=Pseudarthrobacter sulfonivorans TaxID=121292 RepID=UPI00168AC8BF|nr:ABC transporter substrate-binding protein [Pseudarthrobacter sulfonivorans]
MKNKTNSRQIGWRRRLVTAISFMAVMSVAATGCAATSASSTNESGKADFVLYASLGRSGASASFASSIEAGINAAVATVNDQGGLLGRPMKLEVENNESVATKAVSNLQNRLRNGAPDLVWAGSTSSETLAMLSLTTREKVIALNNASAPQIGEASTFPYSFSAGVGNEAQAQFLLRNLKEKGHKTIGVLTAKGAFGEALSSQYKKTFEGAGLTVIPESYEPDAVEMDGPLARIRDKGPDAVVFNDFVHPAYILASRVKAGMGNVPFYGDASTTINDMSKTVSADQKEGVTLMSYKVQTTAADRPAVKNLIQTLNKANVSISSGLYLYALAYDTVLAYANAVEATKSTDVDKVRTAMESGEGKKYALALTDNIGWTKDVHIGAGEDAELFSLIPVSPMVAGQFQLQK